MERRRTILVVTADQRTAFVREATLEAAGYDVVKALGPEAAICLVDAPTYIDLVLMDVDLGDALDGLDTARILQAEHRVPVVFVCPERSDVCRKRLGLVDAYGVVDAEAGEASLLATLAVAFQRQHAERLAREAALRSMFLPSAGSLGSAAQPAAYAS